jgi:toxin ParE1/3/4
MSGQRLFIWPEAEQDFAAATAWYESKAKGLGLDFAREIDIALQKVILNPDLFPILDKKLEVRRVLVSRFPYKIFFVVHKQQIDVCAILHSSQDDRIVKSRLK